MPRKYNIHGVMEVMIGEIKHMPKFLAIEDANRKNASRPIQTSLYKMENQEMHKGSRNT